MFNKLIISTTERRKGRIAKFFCGTSAIYAMVIVGVLALSVVISNPRLADTSERMLTLITPPPPGPPPARQRDNTPPPVVPRNDPMQIRDLDQVINTPVKPKVAPPRLSDFNSDYVAGGLDYGQGPAGPGVPGAHGTDETAAPPPPRPVEPPHPAAAQVDTTRPVRL